MLEDERSYQRGQENLVPSNNASSAPDNPVIPKAQERPWYIRHFIKLLIGFGLGGGAVALLLPWMLWLLCGMSSGSSDQLRLHLLYVTGGIIAVLTLLQTNWKNQGDRLKIDADIKKNEQDAEKNERDHIRQVHAERRSRYTKAVEQLADEKAAVRLGGIYTLVGLVDEWLADDIIDPEERQKEGQVIINNLCSYVRSPFPLAAKLEEYEARKELERLKETEFEKLSEEESSRLQVLLKRFKDSGEYEKPKDITADYAKFHEEQDVRRTIFVEMSKHSSIFTKNEKGNVTKTIPGPWSDFDFDFSRAPIFYPLNAITIEKGNFYSAKFYSNANFIEATFTHTADFRRATFTRTANFTEVTFAQTVNFSEATFARTASFIGASCAHTVDFRRATFTRTANFSEVAFTQTVNFNKVAFTQTADFRRATFTETANFSEVTFAHTASFNGVTFTQAANFIGASFTRRVNFSGATFAQTASFNGVTFAQTANFNGATFTQTASFNGAAFTQTANFIEAAFTRRANFSKVTFIRPANFNKASFAHDANFIEATFTQRANFSGTTFTYDAKFSKASFSQDANFSGATFTQRANFSGVIFTQIAKFCQATFKASSPKFVATFKNSGETVRARFAALSEKQPAHNFVVSNGSFPILPGEAELDGVKCYIPVGTVLFDPDSWDEEKQEYTHVSEPAKPVENSDTEEEKPSE